MKKPNWKDIVDLVGLVAIIASLIFLGVEMRQTKKIALSELEAASQAVVVAEYQLINDNPEVWAKANSNIELTEAERVVFENMVRAISNRIFFTWQSMKRLDVDSSAEGWLISFAGMLYRNPGARKVWEAHEANVNKDRELLDPSGNRESEYVKNIKSKLAKLDQSAKERGL